jgi:hypothetical protein
MVVVPSTSGRLPGADWRGAVNFWQGNKGRKAVCIHINQGWFEKSIEHMAANGTSSHLEVGQKGQIAQLVDFDDSAWANGLSWNAGLGRWICPHDRVVAPTWQLLDPSDQNPNWVTISIENEGLSGKPWPKVQFQANVDALVWLGRRYPSLVPYVVGRTLIGHFHIDPRDKSACPGDGVDLAALAGAANKLLGADLPWQKRWASCGVPLPKEQGGWAIPQAYKAQAIALGGCVRAEDYPASEYSVAYFERGLIYFLKRLNQAFVVVA